MSALRLHPARFPTISLRCAGWIKGLAILLMIAHHAFGLPGLIAPENTPAEVIPGLPLAYWIGRFGKICVALFLFLSGYGFAMRMKDGAAPRWGYFAGKAWHFLLAYWPYFLLALVIGNLFFQQRLPSGNLRFPADPVNIVLNALTLRYHMAYEWWFAQTYLLLVLLARPLLQASKRPLVLLLASLAGFALGAVLDVIKLDPTPISFANLLIWQLPFVCGVLAARWEVPVPALVGARTAAWLALAAVLAGFALAEWIAPAAMTPYLILATPAFMIALVTLWGGADNRATALLGWLGGLTLGLWLVHPFLCYYFAQDWIYAPHWAPLVFAFLLAASLAVVVPVEWVMRKVMPQ